MECLILSVNGSKLEPYEYLGKTGLTGFGKKPLEGPQKVNELGLVEDCQADLENHGGKLKAVYLYPSEHFEYWKKEFNLDAHPGSFGENLTTKGLLESELRVGDILKIGSCELEIGQPRKPCFKLEMKLGRKGFIKPFLQSKKVGVYCRVLKPGEIYPAKAEILQKNPENPSISEIVDWSLNGSSPQNLEKALKLEQLSPEWVGLLKSKLLK